MTRLDQAAAEIKNATSLRELHDALIEFEDTIKILDESDEVDGTYLDQEWELKSRGIDICKLPTFGGNEPRSTDEVWSWDTERILTGVGSFHDWEIRELGEEDRLQKRKDPV